MAMNHPGDDSGSTMSAEDLDLVIATQALRVHTDERWVEIRDSMLAEVISRSRASHSLRGGGGPDGFHVSEQVLTAYVLDALDPIPHIEVDAIRIHADQDRYTGITILVTAQHGLPLLPAADAIRHAAQKRLIQVLGASTPQISVETMHVHVEDVTPGDPGLR